MSTKNVFDLTGIVVLITGGAGFLGKNFARSVAEAGGKAVLADVNEEITKKAAEELSSETGAEVVGYQMDVTSKDSINKIFDEVVGKYGHVDVVVNNAGIDPKFDANAQKNEKLFENYPEELMKKSIEVNLLGCTLVAQAAVQRMLKKGKGHIINISSLYGLVGPDQGIYPEGTQKPVDYSITKGGVVMLTRWLATSYAKHGIRANTITLGGVFKNHPEEFLKKYGAKVPNGKMLDTAEVGPLLVFLASDASSAVTGHNLVADHGFTAW